MKHLKTIMSVMLILAAVSCTKHQTAGNGQVTFDLQNNLQITHHCHLSMISSSPLLMQIQ